MDLGFKGGDKKINSLKPQLHCLHLKMQKVLKLTLEFPDSKKEYTSKTLGETLIGT